MLIKIKNTSQALVCFVGGYGSHDDLVLTYFSPLFEHNTIIINKKKKKGFSWFLYDSTFRLGILSNEIIS